MWPGNKSVKKNPSQTDLNTARISRYVFYIQIYIHVFSVEAFQKKIPFMQILSAGFQ